MVGTPPRIGAAQVFIPVKLPTTLVPDLTTVAFTASAANLLDQVLNEVNAPLDTTATYYVMLAPLGQDTVNGGLTLGGGSAVAGPVSVTAGQGILVNIAASNFPVNLTQAYAMGVYLRKNTSNFAIQNYAYIDPNGNDFNFMITCEPLPQATSYTSAVLQETTPDSSYPELGSRDPAACTFAQVKTTGGVQVQRNVGQVTVLPDDSPDYILATARGTSLVFRSLPNDMKDVVQAAAGKYGKYTVSGGHTVSTANMSLQTAVALTTGNVPFKLVLPPDQNRIQEVRLYLASITTNQTSTTEDWTKTAITPLQYNVQTINLDPLLNNVSAEICYKFAV